MTVFIYMRKTRCKVELFASEKIMRPGGTVPIARYNPKLHSRGQGEVIARANRIIQMLMNTLRDNRHMMMTFTIETLFAATGERIGFEQFSTAKFVPESYTSTGAVFARACIEVK